MYYYNLYIHINWTNMKSQQHLQKWTGKKNTFHVDQCEQRSKCLLHWTGWLFIHHHLLANNFEWIDDDDDDYVYANECKLLLDMNIHLNRTLWPRLWMIEIDFRKSSSFLHFVQSSGQLKWFWATTYLHILPDKLLRRCKISDFEFIGELVSAKNDYIRILWFIYALRMFSGIFNADLLFWFNLFDLSAHPIFSIEQTVYNLQRSSFKWIIALRTMAQNGNPFDKARTSSSSFIFLCSIILFSLFSSLHTICFIRFVSSFRLCNDYRVYASHLLKSYRYANEWFDSTTRTFAHSFTIHI